MNCSTVNIHFQHGNSARPLLYIGYLNSLLHSYICHWKRRGEDWHLQRNREKCLAAFIGRISKLLPSHPAKKPRQKSLALSDAQSLPRGEEFSQVPSLPSLPRCKCCCLNFEANSNRDTAQSQPLFLLRFLCRNSSGEKNRARTLGAWCGTEASSGGSRKHSPCLWNISAALQLQPKLFFFFCLFSTFFLFFFSSFGWIFPSDWDKCSELFSKDRRAGSLVMVN